MIRTETVLSPVETLRVLYFDEIKWKTGDILLWSNKTMKLRTDIEKILLDTKYTHVGIVIVDDAGDVWTWETYGKHGNTLNCLEELLKRNTDQCIVRQINKCLDRQRVMELVNKSLTVPYSFGFWKAVINQWTPHMPVAYRAPVTNKPQRRFCSELVAETLVHANALDFTDSSLTPGLLLPSHFSQRRSDDLPWIKPHKFGKEITVLYRDDIHARRRRLKIEQRRSRTAYNESVKLMKETYKHF